MENLKLIFSESKKNHPKLPKRPTECSNDLYDVMLKCWQREPNQRPEFEQVVKDVKKLCEKAKKNKNKIK